ncbi:MAG: TRAP-type C4-dicarboxylate transporter [Thermotoga sp. 47_83]|nr:MAG: TRAP-type C4-dicarboxylate transporter [Thermotoga sp. 47_83]
MRTFAVLERILRGVLYVLFLMLIFLTFFQVIMRYCFNSPISWLEEFLGVLMIFFALIGAAWGVRFSIHISLELFARWIFGENSSFPSFLECLSYFVLGFFLFDYGLDILRLTKFQILPATGLKVSYVYFALPFSGLIMVFFAGERFLNLMAERRATQRNQ